MERSVNIFKGLNQDISYDSIEHNYVDAKDIRISTTNGESNASFTNLQGTEEAFTIPQNDFGTPIGVKEIIGVATIRNRIFIFTTDNSNTNGWIYKIEYNENRNIINGTPTIVYWNANLQFSKSTPIEALGRYESDCVQRLYWTDYNNHIRSINVEDPNLLTTDVGLIDIFPDVTWTQPIIQAIQSGGNLLTGTYQAAYKLITFDGKETLISPPSVTLHIVSDSENVQSSQYTGDLLNTNTGKAIQVKVDTTNYQDFEKIVLIIVFNDTLLGTPQIFEVESLLIGSQTSLSFIYTGAEDEIIVAYDEYNTKNYSFKTCKTLTQKDGSLVVSNVKQERFSISDLLEPGETFDATTRRYNSLGEDQNTAETLTLTNLQLAFNEAYNLDAHWDSNWHLNKQYKYQSNGLTLGGEGLNISYSFVVQPIEVDSQASPSSFGVGSTAPTPPALGDTYTYFNNSYPSQASPQLSGLIRGFKRGETYRIGLVVFNNKGESSFVEFIGDIKFPDISETSNVANASGELYFPISKESGTSTIAYNLGLEFTIDLTSCPSLATTITSYQIVRVQREKKDQRRITSGIMRNFYYNPLIGTAGPDYDFSDPLGADKILHLHSTFGGNFNDGNFNLLPTQDVIPTETFLFGDYFAFYSPEISFNFNNFQDFLNSSPNLHLLITGAYKDYTNPSANFTINNDGVGYDSTGVEDLGVLWDIRKRFRTTLPIDRFTALAPYTGAERGIEYIRAIADKSFRTTNNVLTDPDVDFDNIAGPFTGGAGPFYMRNFYTQVASGDSLNRPNGDSSSFVFKGVSGLLGRMTSIFNDPITNVATPIPSPNVYFRGGTQVIPLGTTSADGMPIMDIVIARSEIYNGYSDEALASNVFIPCSPVIPITDLNFKMFGGDIFLGMWVFNDATTWNNQDFYQNAPANNRYVRNVTKTLSFVIETFVNLDLNHGSTLKSGVTYDVVGGPSGIKDARYRQETNNWSTTYGKTKRMYDYNNVFSKESDNIRYFSNPRLNAGTCYINDIRTYLSDVKTNEEVVDSWTKFGALNYWDVDDYGPINKIINYKNYIYFFQDKAVGVLSINPRALVPTNDGIQTELGTAQGIVDHQYISETNGSIHQWAVKATDSGIYYFDGTHKKFFVVTGSNNPLSEIKGLHSFCQLLNKIIFLRKENGGDNPILGRGVHITNDKINDEVLITFNVQGGTRDLLGETTYYVGDIVFIDVETGYRIVTTTFTTTLINLETDLVANSDVFDITTLKDITLVYDELAQEFSSFYTATPPIYLENGNILMSPNPSDTKDIYTHNKGNWGEIYGNVEESFIKLVINPNADLNKVLRFIEYNSIVRDNNKVIDRTKTITAFRVETQYQDTGKTPFSTTRIKRKFDKWRLKIPRDQLSTSQQGRLRSTYFLLTLYFDNTENKEIIVNRIMSYYDVQTF
jgi:hypothetical protein